MKPVMAAFAAVLFLAACSDGSNDNQADPVDNTPQQSGQSGNTAPTDQDPTPQTGTGGQSPATSPSGTVQR